MLPMFDSVLVRERVVGRRLGGSVLIVVFLHAAALVSVMSLTRPRLAEPAKAPPIVRWFSPRAALPLLGGEAHPARPTTHHPQTRRDILVQPPVPASEPVQKSEVEEQAPAVTGPVEGVAWGAENGKPDGKRDGAKDGTGICTGPACAITGQPIARVWTKDMPVPLKLSGPDPEYTTQAQEHEVEGWMSVRCIISRTGQVHDCQILKGLPFMNRAVIDALEARTYAPATEGGQAIDIEYTFNIHVTLPPQ
jgi:protein TonB